MFGAVVAMAGLLAAGVAQAQGPGPRGDGQGRGRGGPSRGAAMMLPLRDLALSDAQREQVEQLRAANRDEVQAAQARVREAEAAQRAAIQTVPLDESLVRSTTQALALAQTDLAIQEARMYNDVWQLLTPEQQSKLREVASKTDRPRRAGPRS
jgi:Spy/CpxP family protein refolding chaperone